MAPQKAIPIIESVYSYCREDDGHHSVVKKISERRATSSRKSSNDSNNTLEEDTESFIVGDRVWVGGNKPGIIAFIGETHFGPGDDWAGIVLDEPIGKNNGTVSGVRYFQCAPNRGTFARLKRLSRAPSSCHMRNIACSSPTSPSFRSSSPFSYHSRSDEPVDRRHKSLQRVYLNGTEVKIGDRVIVQSSQGSKAGVLRYCGNTEFGNGFWCGVELDEPLGKNDGTVAGVRYFDCEAKFGIFVPAEKVSRSPVSRTKSPACVVHSEGISRQETSDSIVTNVSSPQNGRSAASQGSYSSTCRSPKQIRLVKIYYPDWKFQPRPN